MTARGRGRAGRRLGEAARRAPRYVTGGGRKAASFQVGDHDGDGLQDLSITAPAQRALDVYFNTGTGGLSRALSYDAGIGASGHLVADTSTATEPSMPRPGTATR